MSTLAGSFLGILVFSAGVLVPGAAHAQCCEGYTEATACAGANLTKSRWCIEDSVPTGQAALPAEFCAYGDVVVSTLEELFNIPAPEILEYQLDSQTGGAHTGTSCGRLGVGVAYDAFAGSAYDARGFWGYLLALHEAINDWTGMSSPGWPTDFWADHQSAFPNLMDFHIMETIGNRNQDDNLLDAAAAQKRRFYPGGDSADAKVVALDNVFAAMPGGDGYAGFSRMFALQSGDGVRWNDLGVPNPDVKRTEYVVAYMSLAAGQRVLSILQGPGANGGGDICNGTFDGHDGDDPYVCDSGHIDAIATAHCSIAANGDPENDLDALRRGDYADVPSGPCGATCPSECACDTNQHCVALWLGEPAADAGSGGSASGGAASGGGAGSGGAPGAAGGPAGQAGGGGSGGTTTGVAGGSGTGGSSATPDGGVGGNATSDEDSGCGCTVARTDGPALGALLFGAALGLGALRRGRARRR